MLDEAALLPVLSQPWRLGTAYLFTRILSMPLEESIICMAEAWERPAHDFPLIDTSTSFSHRPPRHALLRFRIWKKNKREDRDERKNGSHFVQLLISCWHFYSSLSERIK